MNHSAAWPAAAMRTSSLVEIIRIHSMVAMRRRQCASACTRYFFTMFDETPIRSPISS
jgi:hypothetical protein